MIQVTLYSRQDCHLCEQAHADLQSLHAKFPHTVTIVDVDSSKELRQAYGLEVPVIEVGPYRLKAPFTRQEIGMTLAAANDREKHIAAIENSPALENARQSGVWTGADAFAYWFTRHYLAMFNLFVFIYLGLPFLAPVLMTAGIEAPARLIYRSYSLVCHQLAYRSFFLFGEQVAYPRGAAGVVELDSFERATGIPEGNSNQEIFAARNFIGNREVGYKVALCSRDIGIYAAILAFGLLYSLTGRRLPPLPWYLWLLIGIIPIGVDGLSQLLSQPPFEFWAYRESTPYMRTLTGLLFGFATAWFGYPLVEETMADSRQVMAGKYLRVKKWGMGNG